MTANNKEIYSRIIEVINLKETSLMFSPDISIPDGMKASIKQFYEKEINDYIAALYDAHAITKRFMCEISIIPIKDIAADSFPSKTKQGTYIITIPQGMLRLFIDETSELRKKHSFVKMASQDLADKFNAMNLDANTYDNADALTINLMLLSVVFHELGHILSGHCDAQQMSFKDKYLYQAREYLADYYSFQSVFYFVCLILPKLEITTVIGFYFEACSIYWSLLGVNDPPINWYIGTGYDHPHSLVRFKYMISWISDELEVGIISVSNQMIKQLKRDGKSMFKVLHKENIYGKCLFCCRERKEVKRIEKRVPTIKMRYSPYSLVVDT